MFRLHTPNIFVKMNVALHRGLGLTGALILLHAGYSAFESLSYAKSINPASPLEIPLDVSSSCRSVNDVD